MNSSEADDMIDEAAAVLINHLQKQNVEIPNPEVLKLYAYLLATVKCIYAEDWEKTLDVFEQACIQYSANYTISRVVEVVQNGLQEMGMEVETVDASGSINQFRKDKATLN